MECVTKCDLVVWDDIGSKNGTEFEVSHLLSIIDQRINNGKSNIEFVNVVNGVEKKANEDGTPFLRQRISLYCSTNQLLLC